MYLHGFTIPMLIRGDFEEGEQVLPVTEPPPVLTTLPKQPRTAKSGYQKWCRILAILILVMMFSGFFRLIFIKLSEYSIPASVSETRLDSAPTPRIR